MGVQTPGEGVGFAVCQTSAGNPVFRDTRHRRYGGAGIRGLRASFVIRWVACPPGLGKTFGMQPATRNWQLIMTTDLLQLDGSFGEGGGQILRTSLALSCITGR